MALLWMATTGPAAAELFPVIYVNGIQNTLLQAAANAQGIRQALSTSANFQGAVRHAFAVGMIWNPIGFYGSTADGDRWQDNKELFLLKTAEEKYAASFQKILAPHFAVSHGVDRAAAAEVKAYLDAPNMAPGGTSLELNGDLPVDAMLATQRATRALTEAVRKQGRAVVVAHSQGNLLANLSYASLVEEFGDESTSKIRIVNVANTSQFSANALDFTHSDDLALSLLVGLPSGPGHLNWNRSTPNCPGFRACDFVLAQPKFGVGSGYGDFFHHGIAETYMSADHIVPVLDAQGVSFTPGAIRFVDRFVDMVYAAANSLRIRLAVSAVGPGLVRTASGDCQGTCLEYVARDQDMVLRAVPDPGARFVAWSGNCSGSDLQTTVRVDSTASCVAQFDVLAAPESCTYVEEFQVGRDAYVYVEFSRGERWFESSDDPPRYFMRKFRQVHVQMSSVPVNFGSNPLTYNVAGLDTFQAYGFPAPVPADYSWTDNVVPGYGALWIDDGLAAAVGGRSFSCSSICGHGGSRCWPGMSLPSF